MDAVTLAAAMGCSRATADQYVADFNAALIAAGCTTVNRAAMFCAQVGHESMGLRYMEEIASGSAYEGRKDLGNTQPGDGVRFKGRGPIQLTGRSNYGKFGEWCRSRGFVDRVDYFTQNPTLVATSKWGFLAAAWYWTVARPALNSYADASDVRAATLAINGGTNGLAARTDRWTFCLRLGSALLPAPAAPATSTEDDVSIQNFILSGSGEITPRLPVGNGAVATSRAWISANLRSGATQPGRVRWWFQGETAGIGRRDWTTLTVKDGLSVDCGDEIPAGTRKLNIQYEFPEGGTICLEAIR